MYTKPTQSPDSTRLAKKLGGALVLYQTDADPSFVYPKQRENYPKRRQRVTESSKKLHMKAPKLCENSII